MTEKTIGMVKWFSARKGFGFIQRAEGADVFVHYSQIVGDGYRLLVGGELVEYELHDTGRGPAARNVRSLRRWRAPLRRPEPETACHPAE